MNTLTTFYKSRLPHWTPIGGTFFITFRLKDSLPLRTITTLHLRYEREKQRITSSQLSPARIRQEFARARYHFFRDYDRRMDALCQQEFPLAKPEVAEIVKQKLHELDGRLYDLIAYCIMPNHVHLLLSLGRQTVDEDDFYLEQATLKLNYLPLHKIMRLIKGSTAREINKWLGRTGTPLWQKDSYDHFIRNQKGLTNVWWYILNNPVQAGLVAASEDYPHTYYRTQ